MLETVTPALLVMLIVPAAPLFTPIIALLPLTQPISAAPSDQLETDGSQIPGPSAGEVGFAPLASHVSVPELACGGIMNRYQQNPKIKAVHAHCAAKEFSEDRGGVEGFGCFIKRSRNRAAKATPLRFEEASIRNTNEDYHQKFSPIIFGFCKRE